MSHVPLARILFLLFPPRCRLFLSIFHVATFLLRFIPPPHWYEMDNRGQFHYGLKYSSLSCMFHYLRIVFSFAGMRQALNSSTQIGGLGQVQLSVRPIGLRCF